MMGLPITPCTGSLCMAELGTLVDVNGGDYMYLKLGLGNLPAYLYAMVSYTHSVFLSFFILFIRTHTSIMLSNISLMVFHSAKYYVFSLRRHGIFW